MKFNFKDFINIENHNKEIHKAAQKIKSKCIQKAPISSKLYLDTLADYFLRDIQASAKLLYETILNKNEKINTKIIPSELEEYFNVMAKPLFDIYKQHLYNYNMGMMLTEYKDITLYIESFIDNANQILTKQKDIYCSKYRNYLKKQQYAKFFKVIAIIKSISTIIGTITGVIALINAIILYKMNILNFLLYIYSKSSKMLNIFINHSSS